jgi:hypothetical protein
VNDDLDFLRSGGSGGRPIFTHWSVHFVEIATTQHLAEGQRLIYGLLAAAAGMFCGIGAVAMIALLMWGGWSLGEEHTIVITLGLSLGGFIGAMIVVIVGLLAGGPVGRFKVTATRDGASMEAAQ